MSTQSFRLANHVAPALCRQMSTQSFRLADRLSPALRALPEVSAASMFASRVDVALATASSPARAADIATVQAQPVIVASALTAAMVTTHLHTHSRIAAYEGTGYYTIGPCG